MRLIDADALKEIFDDNLTEIVCQDVANIIDEQPTIDPFSTSGYVTTSTDGPPVVYAEQKHGKWIVDEGACEPDYMRCSCCGWITEYYGGLEEEWNYCPNCGAKMERSEE